MIGALKGAQLAAIAGAILAAGITLRLDYDATDDELHIRIRKIRPLAQALNAPPAEDGDPPR